MSGQIEYIRSFLAVARNGGFSLAARALGLSPTIVTRHIGELEAQLGVQLFTRTTRKVDLTDAGRLYRRRVAPVVQELDAANADVRHRQIGLSGPLNVSVPMSFGLRFLPDIVAQFRTLHPGVTLRVALSDHFVDIAGEGFDLALRISRPPADLTTIWRKICQIPRVLVAAPAYVAVRGVPDDPAQLRDHTCLDYAHDDTVQPWVLSNGAATRRVAVTPCFTANNGDVIGEIALRGEGIALLPRFIVQQGLDERRLVQVLADWQPPEIWLTTTIPPYDQLPAKVSAFITFVESHMAGKTADVV